MGVKIPIARFKSLAVASVYDSAVTVTALSNASEAVATAAAHGLVNGDFVEITSGWPRLDGRIARVKSAATGTFVLEGMNTTSTDLFPAGEGIGTVRKVTTWATIPNPKDIAVSGGDPKTLEVDYVDLDDSVEVQVGKNPTRLTIPFKNDVTTAGFAALLEADADATPRALRAIRKDGNVHLYNGTMALADAAFSAGQDITNTLTVALAAKSIQYPPAA
jgi:hypothetical protein